MCLQEASYSFFYRKSEKVLFTKIDVPLHRCLMNKGFAMLGIGKTGFIEKPIPECGPLDAIVKPLALAPCTSDIHTVFAGAIGERSDMFLGHEGVGEIR